MQALVDSYKLWSEVQNHFPKKLRFTLGAKIDGIFLGAIVDVYSATFQSAQTKLPSIEQAIKKVDLLKFMLQIAWETKCLDNAKFIVLSEPLHEIGRMLFGWKENILKKKTAALL